MSPVSEIIMPFNNRFALNPEASEGTLGAFVDLPIPMPESMTAWTGPDGKPVVLWCDSMRIRPSDFAIVLAGIREFNADCQARNLVWAAMADEGVVITDSGDEDADNTDEGEDDD